VIRSVSHRDGQPERIALYELSFVDEGDQVIIGRPEIDSFAVFSADAAAVVRKLSTGEDIQSVAAWYQAAYGDPVDIGEFVDTLHDLGFLLPAGHENTEPTARAPIRWQRLGSAVLSVPALILYAISAAAAVYLMVAHPVLRPTPSRAFFTRSLLVVIGVTSSAQLAGIALHESFHVLAGRRLGLPSKISIGRRLYYVVIQTTLAGLMGVPSRKRILPFLAGLVADTVLVSALTGLAEISRMANWPLWTARVAVACVYATLLRIVWQALIFMETDLTHVLASALRCPDLHRMARIYLRNHVARLRGRPAVASTELGWTDRELRTVRWYAPFVVVGSTAMIGLAASTVIPFVAGLAIRVYQGVVTGSIASPLFWDSLVAGTAVISQFAVVALLALRDRRRRFITQSID
jgi:hypothetical protein